ncbi:MAG: elongation factor G [Geminicoccaceae bacterium]
MARSTHLNIALVGPNGSGKTSLLESMAFVTEATTRKGRVGDGNTVGDNATEARDRNMSTEVSAATLAHDGCKITVLDCPGSAELGQEARNVLPGVDLAIVVVEPVVERMIAAGPVLHFLDAIAVPHMVFVNKMDRSEQRYRDLLDALREVSSRPVVPHHYAIGRGDDLVGYIDLVTEQAYHYNPGAPSDAIELPPDHQDREQAARAEMLETLADFDDDLLEMLLEDQEPPAEQILKNMQKTLGADQVVPVYMGVAEKDMGVRRLMDVISAEAPVPGKTAERLGIGAEGPALVQILKTYHQPHSGKLSLARVWRGEVTDGMTLGGMRVSGLFELLGGQTTPVSSAPAGAVVGLGRLEDAQTGQCLANGSGDATDGPAAPEVAKPMFAFAIQPKNRSDEVKLSAALAKLREEDPSLVVEQNPELHETLIWGQGEVHLGITLARLANKHKVEVDVAPPQTPYRETIKKPGHGHGRHKKQSGGHGQFGDVKIDIKPLARGEGFVFTNKIVGGAVPKQYIPAVETGAREFMARGPLGFPVVDVAVTLVDGQFHSVDSSEMAFKTAAALALREGLPGCKPVLLEPVLNVRIAVPSAYTSKVLSLITTKRGQVLGYDAKPGWHGWDQVEANLPQAEMHDLIINLRSLSQGVGFFEWDYDHMQEMPQKEAQAVVAQRQAAE